METLFSEFEGLSKIADRIAQEHGASGFDAETLVIFGLGSVELPAWFGNDEFNFLVTEVEKKRGG